MYRACKSGRHAARPRCQAVEGSAFILNPRDEALVRGRSPDRLRSRKRPLLI